MKRITKKLALNLERVRVLSGPELDAAVGGGGPITTAPNCGPQPTTTVHHTTTAITCTERHSHRCTTAIFCTR
jgi:hypothetical protein